MTTHSSDLALMRLGEALKSLSYHHICVTPATHARVNSRKVNSWALNLNDVFGWGRPFREGVLPSEVFQLMHRAGVLDPYEDGWRSALRASTIHKRLYFHGAWPTTDVDSVFFGPDTYRYVDAVSHYLCGNDVQIHRMVDIGCGAGPGAIELALRVPGAEVLAVDINDAALRLARVNAALANAQIQCTHSNLLMNVTGFFDLIIANPPYMMDPLTRSYRHGDGPLGAGLSLRIIATSLERLSPTGTLLLYTGSAIVNGKDLFLEQAARLLQDKYHWTYREIDPDVFGEELDSPSYQNVDRIAAVFLSVRRSAERLR